MPFDQVCRRVRVVERVCFCLTLINIHHYLYNCYIHISYTYCLNEYRMFLFSIYTEKIIINFFNVA